MPEWYREAGACGPDAVLHTVTTLRVSGVAEAWRAAVQCGAGVGVNCEGLPFTRYRLSIAVTRSIFNIHAAWHHGQ